jgi:hypothetical protein
VRRLCALRCTPRAADADKRARSQTHSPAQREAAARLAAGVAAKAARRGGLAKASADGSGARSSSCCDTHHKQLTRLLFTRQCCRLAAPAPSRTSPIEVGTAFVSAAWVGGFALAAVALQKSGRLGGGGDDASS